ncbi:MAG: N(4)-(beta-N-acetylglucosaminyl)-L-asparaginase [Acidobacteriota bacterium]
MALSRRKFIATGSALAAAAFLPRGANTAPLVGKVKADPTNSSGNLPVVISSDNGLRGVAKAFDMMVNAGADPLDAAIAGVNIQELDPEDRSVGLGGRPNEDGVVQLDASCMHGPSRRAGAVGCLEGIASASLVAKAVMDYTNHIFLVGAGAKRFALDMGFKEQDLLTDKTRQHWLRWKSKRNSRDNWLDHDADVEIARPHGTINMNAVDAEGNLGSVTTTSGLPWKIPGRVGDSPIIGAGQYCDNSVGAAGATGHGEANIKVCGAFLVVELMRTGVAPQEACLRVMKRVVEMTEKRLLDGRNRPLFDMEYYALSKDGRYASVAMYEGGFNYQTGQFAVADARGARLEDQAFLYKASERPTR